MTFYSLYAISLLWCDVQYDVKYGKKIITSKFVRICVAHKKNFDFVINSHAFQSSNNLIWEENNIWLHTNLIPFPLVTLTETFYLHISRLVQSFCYALLTSYKLVSYLQCLFWFLSLSLNIQRVSRPNWKLCHDEISLGLDIYTLLLFIM